MALLFLEGFEGYSNFTDMTSSMTGPCRWTSLWFSGNGSGGGLSTSYRTAQPTVSNSRSLYFTLGSDYSEATLNISSSTEIIAGFGYYFSDATPAGTWSICAFGGTSNTTGIALGMNGSRFLYAATPTTYGSAGTQIGSASATSLPVNVWNYIEVRAKIGTTTGEFEVRVNGVQYLNLTGINTAAGSITSYRTLSLAGGATAWITHYFDDLYVADTTGTVNNTFLGPLSVYSLMPNGAGSSTQFNVTGAASNYLAVDDPTNDSSTTYVSSSTTGHQDLYTLEDLPGAATNVLGVMVKARGSLPVSGTRKMLLLLKEGASTITSGLKTLAMGSWLHEYHISETAPDGSPWTPATVNSTEAGIEAG